MKDTSTLSEQELPVQCAHGSEDVNRVKKATDVNGYPSKDSYHTIDAENMTVDEPDCTLDSVEVNTVDDANGHPSQNSDVTIDMENSNVDEFDIIHDSSKINDANAKQTESMDDVDVEQNDASQNIIQGLQKETVSDDVKIKKADKTTDAFGHVDKDSDDRIDEENTIIDQGKDLSIQAGVEMNNATPMEGGSVNIGEQNIVQDGLTSMQELLTSDFNNNEDQIRNHEEVKNEDYGIGGSSDSSEVEYDSSDSPVKLSAKHIKQKSKKKFTIPFDEDSADDVSEGYESGNSHFSETSLKEQQDEHELPKRKQSKRLHSVRLKRGTIAVGVQSLEDIAYKNDASKSTSNQLLQLSLLNNEEFSLATAIDQPSKKTKTKKTKENNLNIGKDMSMLVFNPCIMVFSTLFNVIMLPLKILKRRPSLSVFQSSDKLQIDQYTTNSYCKYQG
jgi:hypothetical protein